MMRDVEHIKLVSEGSILPSDRNKSHGPISYGSLVKMTSADNFVEGQFTTENDSTLAINCAIVNGNTGEYIIQFPIQYADLTNPEEGFIALGKRIVGYLISAEFDPLSLPTSDAFKAYLMALRMWTVDNYEPSIGYLQSAITYDTTFLDAYYGLADTYHNRTEFHKADSVLAVIGNRFSIESQNSRQINTYYYYQALHARDHASAYKYLMRNYNRNKRDLFKNSTAANYSLFYVNAPDEAIKILDRISFDKLDYSIADNKFRLKVGVQAHYAIGEYKRAAQIARLYPTKGMTLREHKFKIRAFAGVLDTVAINNEIAQVQLNLSKRQVASTLFWTFEQFYLQDNEQLAEHYLEQCLASVKRDSVLMDITCRVLHETEQFEQSLIEAKKLHSKYPYWLPYKVLLGSAYVATGNVDSAQVMVEQLRSIERSTHDLGEPDYYEAQLLTVIGDHRSALIKLQDAVDNGLIFYEFRTQFDLLLEPLFENSDFQKIIHPLEN